MKPIFYHGVASKIILNIKPNINMSELTRKTSGTYSHITKTILILEETDLLTKEKIGRISKLNLTKKGEKLKKLLIGVEKLT